MARISVLESEVKSSTGGGGFKQSLIKDPKKLYPNVMKEKKDFKSQWGKKVGGETLLRVLASLLLVRPHTNQYVCTNCGEALKTKSPTRHMDSHHVLVVFVL